jgi:UPF0755 protein
MSHTARHPDPVDSPPKEGHGGKIALIALLLIVALVAGGWWALRSFVGAFGGPEDYPGPGSGEVVVEVTAGQSAAGIGRTLAEKDVVASAQAFTDAARADDRSRGIQPGFYALAEQMKASDALTRLLDPASRVENQVTLREGLRLDQAVELIAKETDIPLKDFEAALEAPDAIGLPGYAKGNAEGFLFPATYTIRPDAKATDVLAEMVQRFDVAAEEVGLASGAHPAYETLIVASLVEAEARHAEDYPKVARVVYNRLAIDMRLQFDSTVNYALKANKELVTHADLGTDSPYNTYKHAGLPPAPISSPGEAAMHAALEPAKGDWLYFVSVDDAGTTKFTADYGEFLRFKAELKRNRGQ